MRIRQMLTAILLVTSVARGSGQENSWIKQAVGFTPIGVVARDGTFWTFGVGEGIASSTDGAIWKPAKVQGTTGALLLGLRFSSRTFGYAFGTNGAVLFTEDGGATWQEQKVANKTILLASFARPQLGLIRTSNAVSLVRGGAVTEVPLPSDVPHDFTYVPAVIALSPTELAFSVSQGWKSRTGFVSTTNGGSSWSFYEIPHMTPYDLLGFDGQYWVIGNETVGYDRNGGGGLGVPAVFRSQDGKVWTHGVADLHICHWQGCEVCNESGCLAGSKLLVRPYGAPVTAARLPEGRLTAQWASTQDRVCSVDAGALYCALLLPPGNTDKDLGMQPEERALPPLGGSATGGLLQCIMCGAKNFYVDPRLSGQFEVHLHFKVASNGTVDAVDVKDAPSEQIANEIKAQALSWLFESPVRDGRSVSVATSTTLHIMVMRSR